MRLIPGKTKVKIELFKGVSLVDLAIGAVAAGLMLLIFVSNLPAKLYLCIAVTFVAALLLIRFDAEPSYVYILHIIRHYSIKRYYNKTLTDEVLTKTDNRDELLEGYLDAEKEAKAEKKENELTKKERKKREKQLYAQEKKILASKTATKAEKDAVWLARANRSADRKSERKQERFENIEYSPMDKITAFTGIKDGYIEYAGEYFGKAIEIPPVEFRFFSNLRRINSIENGVGRILRSINPDFAANIIKIERPMLYDRYIEKEKAKLDEIRNSYEIGYITEEELKARADVVCSRIDELRKYCFEERVVQPFYYIVLFDTDKKQLDNTVAAAVENLVGGEMMPQVLNDKELAVFLKYTNDIDFDEREIDKIPPENYAQWAMPQTVAFKARTVEVNHILTHNMRSIAYPSLVDDAWMAGLMTIPSTKVVVKCKPMDRQKSVSAIDRSLQEINDRLNHTGIESRRLELSAHAETLSELLSTLQGENETLLSVNIYVTSYDIGLTRNTSMPVQPPKSMRTSITSMRKAVRRIFNESRVRLENMDFNQLSGYLGGQVSGYDPMTKDGRGMPGNSVAAAFPWIYSNVSDENGVKVGLNDDVPVFLDFFRRDSERVNSNMVIVGKSGSGKSYATKSILTNLAADGAKIFILDPENEYSELAHNLHGKMINVGNASQGRINPFHIITALEDDENTNEGSNTYAAHLQFLEEFFKQSLPDCEKNALEYLNALIDRMYLNKGITADTNLSRLAPEDYPIFDDLYDIILREFQSTDSEYIRSMLRSLMNYISKYSAGGRNAAMWNGPSTVTTDENFTVFNFQNLLANRNAQVANSQMLLVLKYIDNEVIKNRDYNTKYHANRKIVVVIDEAHVFIDAKYPIALDFMFQLAKRIRKYNGMQIVITQNIKDFVGSEEIARKSTAIINACQYSFIFSLSPNDMDDLCVLYEKAGGINENEIDEIVSAPRGQAFSILSPKHRTTINIKIPQSSVQMFKNNNYEPVHFAGEEGESLWEEYVGESREKFLQNKNKNVLEKAESEKILIAKSGVSFEEVSGEDYDREMALKAAKEAPERFPQNIQFHIHADDMVSSSEKKKNAVSFEQIDALDEDATVDFGETSEELASDEPQEYEENEALNSPSTPVKRMPLAQNNVSEAVAASNFVLEGILAKLSDAVENMANRSDIISEVSRMMDSRLQTVAMANMETQKVLAGIQNAAPVLQNTLDSADAGDTTEFASDLSVEKSADMSDEAASSSEEDLFDADEFLNSLLADTDEDISLDDKQDELDIEALLSGLTEENESGEVAEDGVTAQVADNSQAEEDTPESLLSSLFADEYTATEEDEQGTIADDDSTDEDIGDDFDILSFLAEEASSQIEASPIDDMLDGDEMVITVTLQELAAFNLRQRL